MDRVGVCPVHWAQLAGWRRSSECGLGTGNLVITKVMREGETLEGKTETETDKRCEEEEGTELIGHHVYC